MHIKLIRTRKRNNTLTQPINIAVMNSMTDEPAEISFPLDGKRMTLSLQKVFCNDEWDLKIVMFYSDSPNRTIQVDDIRLVKTQQRRSEKLTAVTFVIRGQENVTLDTTDQPELCDFLLNVMNNHSGTVDLMNTKLEIMDEIRAKAKK